MNERLARPLGGTVGAQLAERIQREHSFQAPFCRKFKEREGGGERERGREF